MALPKIDDTKQDDRYDPYGSARDLYRQENDKSNDKDISDTPKDSVDFGDSARDGENTSGTWGNNVSKKADHAKQKSKTFLKKKSAAFFITLLLGGGAASLPFFSTGLLPGSIVGNQNMKSVMNGLMPYSQDYMGFTLFQDNTHVQTGGSKLKGLTGAQIDELKAKGVEFEGAKQNPITRKTTFTAVKTKGGDWVHSGAEFKKAMRTNASFRASMKVGKPSLWKSFKSSFSKAAANTFHFKANADLSGKTDADRDQKMQDSASEKIDGEAKVHAVDDPDGKNTNANSKAEAESIAGDFNKDVEARKAAIKAGKNTAGEASSNDMAKVGQQFSKTEGVDMLGDASKGLGGKIWNFIQPLGPLDTVCTIYQTANIANVLARTVVAANSVRFFLSIREKIERALAGDDSDGSVSYLMNLIQRKDPETGKSFDMSSYSAFLFNGELSSEPSSFSAFGGSAMIALYTAMHSLHSVFGDLVSGFTLGATSATAANGRRFLKSACGVLTNLAVQGGATVASLAIMVLTGGTSKGAEVAVQSGIKIGMKTVGEDMVKSYGKAAVKKAIADKVTKIGEEGVLKYMARNSWKGFKTMFKGLVTDPWNMAGLLMAGVSAFGMDYIVNVLAGGDIADAIKNGPMAFDSFGTGNNRYEYALGISNGGRVSNYEDYTKYQTKLQEYQDMYVADMKYEARDTPLDYKNPYSTLGSVIFSIQKTIGISASLNFGSTLKSMATLPLRLPSIFTAHASDKPTPEQIGEQIGNPFFTENKIATTVMGVPQTIFDKKHSFTEIEELLIDSDSPQISAEINSKNETVLSVMSRDNNPDGSLSLSNYVDICHNPNKLEVDPEFTDDENSNFYDTNTCMPGGDNYNSELYPLYDDALAFISQISPEGENTAGEADSAYSYSSPGSTAGVVGNGDDVPKKFKDAAEACLARTGKACLSSTFYGAYAGQCASFADWRFAQQWYGSKLLPDGSNLGDLLSSNPIPKQGSVLSFGNGVAVAGSLISKGLADSVPSLAESQAGDIVSITTRHAGVGHVYVIVSNNNGSIVMEDYNYVSPGRYSQRSITTSHASLGQSHVVSIARVHKNGGNN